MIAYRIYTERKNVDGIRRILDTEFTGYTLISACGVWDGEKESALIIEIIGEENRSYDVADIAHHIALLNSQDAVLITSTVVDSELIRIDQA